MSDRVEVGRITITNEVGEDCGVGVEWSEGLSVFDALGMLEMARITIARQYGRDCHDGD